MEEQHLLFFAQQQGFGTSRSTPIAEGLSQLAHHIREQTQELAQRLNEQEEKQRQIQRTLHLKTQMEWDSLASKNFYRLIEEEEHSQQYLEHQLHEKRQNLIQAGEELAQQAEHLSALVTTAGIAVDHAIIQAHRYSDAATVGAEILYTQSVRNTQSALESLLHHPLMNFLPTYS
ncbi:hypothetical protein [Rothia sp. CCM 9419]|uniref:hypothetical protein n=1 Tax=Rothia sp. CCM 9419 TaxID=3402662 RepID=UPI003AE0C4E3